MKLNIFRRAFALAAVLIALTVSISPASAQRTGSDPRPARTEADASASDRTYLRQVAADEGFVRVIVGLNVNQPGRMAFDTMSETAQAAVLGQAQDALLAQVSVTRSAPDVKRYSAFPLMALDVTPEQFEILDQSSLVAYIQQDRFRELALDKATANIGMTGANGAWAQGADGNGQVIVVLDSGVRKTHVFLAGKVISEACYSSNIADNGTQGYSATSLCPGALPSSQAIGSGEPCTVQGGECDHGTNVAGIAAGKGDGTTVTFNGVAKEAKLISIQVFSKIQDDANSNTNPVCVRVGYPFSECILASDSDIIKAMDYVWSIRNNTSILGANKIAAVNMSFGNEYFSTQAACDASSPAYKAAVAKLVNAGIAVVSSSGNQGLTSAMNLPACITGVTSVGATCDDSYDLNNDTFSDCSVNTLPPFTNAAPFLTFLAPGVNITSADSTNDNLFNQKTGTSQATPFVAGAIAAIKSYRPGASQEQIRQALIDSAVLVNDPGTPQIDNYRKIQVDAALDLLIFPDQPELLIPEVDEAFAEPTITFKWTAGDLTDRYTLEIYNPSNTRIIKTTVLHDDCAEDVDFPDEDLVCTLDVTYAFKDEKTYTWKVIAKSLETANQTASELRPFQFDTPGRATLISPEHKAVINQPEDLFEFTWEEVNLATSYRLTLYDKANGSVKINAPEMAEGDICVAEVCTYTPSPADLATLRDDRKYRWYVTSISDDGTSKSSERMIIAKFPAAPLLTSPEEAHVFTSLSDIELTWTDVAGADAYRLKIVDTGNNKVIVDETLSLGARTITCLSGVCTFEPSPEQLAKFKNKHIYSWTVNASNELGDNTSGARTFKTKFPAPPILIAPTTGLTFDNPAITFEFTEIADADSYELFIVQKNNGAVTIKTNLTPGGNLACDGTDCTYTLVGGEQVKLKNGRTYEWYVRSVSTAGKSSSAKREFTFQSPLPATLTSPTNGASIHSPTDLTFSWSDVGAGANYDLRIKDNTSGNIVVKVAFAGASCVSNVCTYTLTGDQQAKIKDGRTFKWWVLATNPNGTSASAKFGFTTEYPRMPSPITPANNASFGDRADLTVFEWASGGMITPVTYILKIKRLDNGAMLLNQTFVDGVGLTCGVDKCTFTVPEQVRTDLRNNKTYRWWVTAQIPAGSKTSGVFKFKTTF